MNFAIIENQSNSSEKIEELFSFQFPKVQCFYGQNGFELLLYLNTTKQLPTIIFLELNTPVLDGCTASFYLRNKYPLQKIIGFVRDANYETILLAFMSGVNGLIIKKDVKAVLKEAVEILLKDEHYIDSRLSKNDIPNLLKKVIAQRNQFWEKLYSSNPTKLPQNELVMLTDRERQILILITSSLAYKEIGAIMNIERKSVENMTQRLCNKIKTKNVRGLLLFALKYGYSIQYKDVFTENLYMK